MTAYTGIPNGDIDQDSPVTQELFTALRDDPIAMAEGVTGAPVTVAGWHPYNSTLNGTGTGLFYDFAVHGAVASVETPTFSDGYEYLIVVESYSKAGAGAAFQVELYREQAAAYGGAMALGPSPSTGGVSGFVRINLPRRTMRSHFIDADLAIDATNGNTGTTPSGTTNHTTATKIGKARISWVGSVNSTAGKLYLYRRAIV